MQRKPIRNGAIMMKKEIGGRKGSIVIKMAALTNEILEADKMIGIKMSGMKEAITIDTEEEIEVKIEESRELLSLLSTSQCTQGKISKITKKADLKDMN